MFDKKSTIYIWRYRWNFDSKWLCTPFMLGGNQSVSNDNRKRVVCSIEIGLGLFLIILGLGTATCEIEEKENE